VSGAVDKALAEQKFERKIVLRTAHFMVAATVVAQSDLIATLPERVARFCAKRLSLRLLATPLPMTFAVSQVWHERTHYNSAHKWLRELIAEVATVV